MSESENCLVLLVEDDPHLLAVAADYLREVGHEVATATSGREGLAKARDILPDVIVSDIMMQNGSGLYLLENLKRHPATHLVPFVFVTARDSRDDIRRGMALGADDYIPKPFNMDELDASIRSQLEKRERRSRAAAVLGQRHLVSMPHELRTPLNGILGITDLLRDGLRRGRFPSARDLEENLGILHESAVRLLRLIENYLLFYELRLASGNPRRDELYPHAGAEVPLDGEFFSELARRYGREGDLTVDLAPARLPISAELLEKILSELVDNALKFSDPHRPVAVRGTEEEAGYRITVSDRGLGMTPEQVAGVAPFTQFDRAVLEQQGVGLGLCLVRLIADLHGVGFSLDSRPGEGTDVTLRFPPAPASAPAPGPPPAPR
jgi:signal transduction histidine kinase